MALLEARAVSKSFGGVVALSEVSIELSSGEIVGLIGPNGAGKTTFFNCLLGLERPNGGTVVFDGIDLAGMSVSRRARLGIARTFQRMELFPEMSPREHVLVALRARHGGTLLRDLSNRSAPTAQERRRSDAILELLGLADLGDRPVESLSLGQSRLVELGRALSIEPKLLLLDEPSSGLDRTETQTLGEIITGAVHDTRAAVLLVEHDLELVRRVASRVYVLDSGEMLTSGPAAQVLDSPAVRRAYLGSVSADGSAGSRPVVTSSEPLLELIDVYADYGPYKALFGVDLTVRDGSAVALVGPNGAGKSTVARVASGLMPLTSGRLRFGGRDVSSSRPNRLARLGIAHVPEGRPIFSTLTVEENLALRLGRKTTHREVNPFIERAYAAFPILAKRRHQRAGTLSGGEQRMLALAGVLARPPRLLIADELSLGLAPNLIDEVYAALELVREGGTSLLIVEQQVTRAFILADEYVLLNKGTVAGSGPTSEITADDLDLLSNRPARAADGDATQQPAGG